MTEAPPLKPIDSGFGGESQSSDAIFNSGVLAGSDGFGAASDLTVANTPICHGALRERFKVSIVWELESLWDGREQIGFEIARVSLVFLSSVGFYNCLRLSRGLFVRFR
jgi:hypothetical protein